MKNPNGFGTVYKLTGNRRKKWVARKTVSWEDGKQKRVVVGYFESKKEAMEALGKFIYNPNSKVTLDEVYEEWSNYHFKKLSIRVAENTKYIYNAYFKEIKTMYIRDIEITTLQSFFSKLEESLSSASVKRIKSIASMIFDYAVKKDIIDKNIVKFVELKKFKAVKIKSQFSTDEIETLWNNKDMYLVDSVLILIYTGMRISELLNLKIEDISLENEYKVIHVKASKTDAGIRDIPISPLILQLITKNISVGKEYLFLNSKGNKFNYPAYRSAFKTLMEKLNMNHTVHECRHTTATLLSNAGADPTSIIKILGHTDYTLTSRVYTHKDKEQLDKAINLIQ